MPQIGFLSANYKTLKSAYVLLNKDQQSLKNVIMFTKSNFLFTYICYFSLIPLH